MLKRTISSQIEAWARDHQKPLIIVGARQVGKTSVVMETLKNQCQNLFLLNFEKDPNLCDLFQGEISPKSLLSKIALRENRDISIEKDILFFDEIQACERALSSLKYFREDLPNMRIIATGSYLGLKQDFPVGQVKTLHMYPMSFDEFLYARVGDGPIWKAFKSVDLSQTLFDRVWPILLEYFFVGGLPEAVSLWLENREASVVRASNLVRDFQTEIFDNYINDFGKYSRVNSHELTSVFKNVSHQLQIAHEEPVKKFSFQKVVSGKKGYTALSAPINWLSSMRMIHKLLLTTTPISPIISQESIFRAFIFDMGMLSRSIGLSYARHIEDNFEYKGFIAENFVFLELQTSGIRNLFGWRSEKGAAEVEFIIPINEDKVSIPLEVKSGRNTRSQSLTAYKKKYAPKVSVKLIGAPGSKYDGGISLPLYYAGSIKEILEQEYHFTI